MLDGSEADELIAAASHLTAQELSDLAKATRKTLGFGIAAYLVPSRRRNLAMDAACTVGEEAGRGEMMRVKSPLLEDAILGAAVRAATRAGRDASAVRLAWEEFKVSADSGDRRRRRRAFNDARKVFRRGLGRPLDRRWLMAVVGAHWALAAVVTWDLVSGDGPYLRRHRDALTSPWRLVAPLPPSCDST